MQYLDWSMTQKRIQRITTSTSPIQGKRTKRNLCICGKPSQNYGNDNKSNADTPDKYQIEYVYANCSEDDNKYPLTIKEIAEAQKVDATLKHAFKCNAVLDKGLEVRLIENTLCVCKEGRLVISTPLQGRTVMWYHHYL